MESHIAAKFDEFDIPTRQQLLAVRQLIFDIADELKVGPVTEALRWGQPSYLKEASQSGTMLRIGHANGAPETCALFVHCQTSLISEFREIISHPHIGFDGSRAICFPSDQPLPRKELAFCITQALLYKLR